MKRTKRRFMVKLPTIAVEILRKCGGAHSTKKGKRGYSRKNIAKPDLENPVFLKSQNQ